MLGLRAQFIFLFHGLKHGNKGGMEEEGAGSARMREEEGGNLPKPPGTAKEGCHSVTLVGLLYLLQLVSGRI